MSIVVTCSCDMTYRLPERYAGKRCRCRECGEAIKVPQVGDEVPVKSRKSKHKKKRRARAASDSRHAKRTTRRLGSQEQEIRGERRALRRAAAFGAGRPPVSESMHQIAPLALSGVVERPQTLGPAKTRRKAEEGRRRAERDREETPRRTKGKKAKRKQAEGKQVEGKKVEGKKAAGRKPAEGKTKDRKASKEGSKTPAEGAARSAAKTPQRRKKGKGLPSKGAKVGGLERGRGRALAARTGSRGAVAARRAGRLGDRRGVEDEGAELSTPRRNHRTVRIALVAVGVLCLLVGSAFGIGLSGAGSSTAPGGDFAAQLAAVEALKQHSQWDFARDKLQALETEARERGDDQAVAQIRDAFVAVDMMVQLSKIDDEESKLATLVSYSNHQDPTVRLGIAMELRALSSQYEAQEILAKLANDPDAKVQAAARQGLIACGGPFSIPYLAEAIESSAATGNKLGDQALERALELFEPEVVPVLIKALEVRKSAPANVLVAILEHLHELGEPSAVQAAQGFTSHADEKVKAAAQRIVDDLS